MGKAAPTIIIDGGSSMDGTVRVTVGSLVEIIDGELQEFWSVVPIEEADAMRRYLSEASPLGKALLGHQVGDQVRVLGPERHVVTILAVRQP